MIHIRLLYTSLIISLLLVACKPDSPNQSTPPIDEKITTDEVTRPNSQNSEPQRAYWQKPDLVMEKLGNLEDDIIADIGAGMGYFSFELSKRKAKKVIAIDIDDEMIKALNFFKNLMEEKESNFSERFEVRQATQDDPNLKEGEVDIILIVNTIAYLYPKVTYLKNLRTKLREGGKIVIVDFKTKKIPDYVNAPPYENREYLHLVEEDLEKSGYSNIVSDDTTLEFQYIVIAEK
jgi:SAM-dependent methyltransferase